MLYVLDGSGFLFRAYYSLPNILDKNWDNSWAVFWFFRMVLKLLKNSPDNFIIVFDPWKKTKRMEEFEEYKTNRPEMDKSFKAQIPNIIEICKRSGFCVEMIDSYEADDVIASIVKNYNDEIYVVSSDKDLKQLISDNVKFLEPKTMKITDKKDFFEEYGFEPDFMVLYLALLWDSSDNIPWVPWIWKKIASKLVWEYQTLENLFKYLEKLPSKIAEKITQHKDLIEKNIWLIKLYLPWEFEHDSIKQDSNVQNIDFKELENLLAWELGLKSFSNLIKQSLKEINKPKIESLF